MRMPSTPGALCLGKSKPTLCTFISLSSCTKILFFYFITMLGTFFNHWCLTWMLFSITTSLCKGSRKKIVHIVKCPSLLKMLVLHATIPWWWCTVYGLCEIQKTSCATIINYSPFSCHCFFGIFHFVHPYFL
jgi:hypothetical protein